MNLSTKTLILNLLIIIVIALVIFHLQNPLGILGLFWLHQLPQDDYNVDTDVVGDGETIYDETNAGFTGILKK